MLQPLRGFPEPPVVFYQSTEPADMETSLRRGYFTDIERAEVTGWYKMAFATPFTMRLNYPPEEAQTIIRDQTQSWYLEEFVVPMRESVYVNGFVPQIPQHRIFVGDREFYQKVTLRYVPSSVESRVVYVFLVMVAGGIIITKWANLAKQAMAIVFKGERK